MQFSSQISAETNAINELEQAFNYAGWQNGLEMENDEVRECEMPIYYRNSTSTVASEARISRDSETHMLYCIYSIISSDAIYSGNMPKEHEIEIALTFYYDNANLFQRTTHNAFVAFLEELLSSFYNGLWSVSNEGEGAVTSLDDKAPYTHRKIIFIKKRF